MHIYINNKFISYNNYKAKCAVGKRGIGYKRREGDLITPVGSYKIKYLLYRKDRVKKIQTKVKKFEIKKNMGWCDDPKSKKYNKLIKIEKQFKYEKLKRKDYKYNLLIPIKYNFEKPITGLGSCIFIHLTKDYKPTVGCIALNEKDFLIMLKIIKKNSKIQIF